MRGIYSMIKILSVLLSLLATPMQAQQQPAQLTPSQTAIQINGVVGQWAQTIETQQRLISELQQEVAKLKVENATMKKEKENAKPQP